MTNSAYTRCHGFFMYFLIDVTYRLSKAFLKALTDSCYELLRINLLSLNAFHKADKVFGGYAFIKRIKASAFEFGFRN